MSEKDKIRDFVKNIEADNKPAALKNLTDIVESKIRNRINQKKQAILSTKKF
jgi:hypothetical protein